MNGAGTSKTLKEDNFTHHTPWSHYASLIRRSANLEFIGFHTGVLLSNSKTRTSREVTYHNNINEY